MIAIAVALVLLVGIAAALYLFSLRGAPPVTYPVPTSLRLEVPAVPGHEPNATALRHGQMAVAPRPGATGNREWR